MSLLEKINSFSEPVSRFIGQHRTAVSRILLSLAWLSLGMFFIPSLRGDAGSLALNGLILVLFLGPVSRISGLVLLRTLCGFRKELGIAVGMLAIAHGFGEFSFSELFSKSFWWYDNAPSFRAWGIVALVTILPLTFTSNTASQRWLARNWKRLHWLAPFVLPLVIIHTIVLKPDNLVSGIVLVVLYAIVKTLDLLGWRMRK